MKKITRISIAVCIAAFSLYQVGCKPAKVVSTDSTLPVGKEVRVTDSVSERYFVLDKEHRTVTGYDKNNTLLWKCDPRQDPAMTEYRQKDPVITVFTFVRPRPEQKEVLPAPPYIRVQYSNTQAGDIDPESGEFTFRGQD